MALHYHILLIQGGHRNYLVDINQHKCAKLHEIGTFVIRNNIPIVRLRSNSTNYRIVTLASSTNVNSACEGSTYSDSYGTWHRVVVETSITITLREYLTPANTKLRYYTPLQNSMLIFRR